MTKENLIKYKMDYSVYILRMEMKSLGRQLNNDELLEDYRNDIERRMKQLKDTLQLLKDKYKINEGFKENNKYSEINFENGSKIEITESQDVTRGYMSGFIDFDKEWGIDKLGIPEPPNINLTEEQFRVIKESLIEMSRKAWKLKEEKYNE